MQRVGPDPEAIAAGFGVIGLFMAFVMLVSFVLSIIIYWKLASKAGYPGVTSLLMLIPFVNFFIILYYTFAKWPIQQELEDLRRSNGEY